MNKAWKAGVASSKARKFCVKKSTLCVFCHSQRPSRGWGPFPWLGLPEGAKNARCAVSPSVAPELIHGREALRVGLFVVPPGIEIGRRGPGRRPALERLPNGPGQHETVER